MAEENKANKAVIIFIAIGISIIVGILAIICTNAIIINAQMKNAVNAVTIQENVSLYSSKNMSKVKQDLELGTNTYILESDISNNNEPIYKVKVGKKVGYIHKDDLKYFEETNMKKELMLDVSQFNMKNNFSSIGEFKAFVLNNNIKYVYIRAGGRGYGKAGNFYKDTSYKEFADACEYLHIPFGFYFLEEAITSNEVDEEVKFIEDFINENNYEYNKLPIALDIEKHLEEGRADGIWDKRYVLVNELIAKLEQKKYNVIVYSNASIANQYLTKVNTELWLAYYPSITEEPSYWYSDTDGEGATNKELISKMVGWQFSQTGIPNKISKNVDVSIVYSNYFKSGSTLDVLNDISGKSKIISKIFELKDKTPKVFNTYNLGRDRYYGEKLRRDNE